ncbi:MAG TPA: SAM-dependent methyltransferase, partial [Kofleriaceae bacterium]|nr:SAM-dependent methyltransferase [Kofleriaceae bacterium]
MSTPATRARWALELEARAAAYWTPERTAQLLDGKQPIIAPRDGAVLLRALGLMREDASIPPAEVRKYFQINHMVALLGPALRALREQGRPIRLIDAGCGRSYLTLLLAWCARHVWRHPLEVIGIDRDPALIEEARRRTQLAELDDVVRFAVGDVATMERPQGVNGVVALHACDTATCHALALGIELEVEMMAVAPCCQAELARGWASLAERGVQGAFAPVWGAPHLRRETAADITDAMRVELLRAAGYEVTAMEFVPAEHTRKNTLIRAIRRGAPSEGARAAYQALRDATGGI